MPPLRPLSDLPEMRRHLRESIQGMRELQDELRNYESGPLAVIVSMLRSSAAPTIEDWRALLPAIRRQADVWRLEAATEKQRRDVQTFRRAVDEYAQKLDALGT